MFRTVWKSEAGAGSRGRVTRESEESNRHSKSEGRAVWNLQQRVEYQIVVGDPELRSYVAFQDDG